MTIYYFPSYIYCNNSSNQIKVHIDFGNCCSFKLIRILNQSIDMFC